MEMVRIQMRDSRLVLIAGGLRARCLRAREGARCHAAVWLGGRTYSCMPALLLLAAALFLFAF